MGVNRAVALTVELGVEVLEGLAVGEAAAFVLIVGVRDGVKEAVGVLDDVEEAMAVRLGVLEAASVRVAVADGACVAVGRLVGVRDGVLVADGTGEAVAVEVMVGGSPLRMNEPEVFHSEPMKIRTSYMPGSQFSAGCCQNEYSNPLGA